MAKTKTSILITSPQQWLVRLVALSVAVSGTIALLQPLTDRLPNRFIDFLSPVDVDILNRTAATFLGFTLIYFSVKLLQRKVVAWWTALVASVIIVWVNVIYTHSLIAVLVPVLTIAALLATKPQFQVRSESQSIVQGLRLLILSFVIALMYGTVGFWFLEKRDFGHTFGFGEAAVQTFREYSLIGNPDLIPHTRHARWFLHSLDLFGALSVGFGIYSLFRPLAYRFSTLPSERELARAILFSHGNSPDDFFKLWPEDKSYYFSAHQDAFVAYRVAGGVAVVLGAPVGSQASLVPLLESFWDFARASGWIVALVDVPASALGLFESFPFRNLRIGEEAIVELDNFTTHVATNKHFRNIRNRFQKDGYTVERVLPPHQRPFINEIHTVSNQWLKTPGRQERGFALGYFNRRYLNSMPLYVLRNLDGRIMAFANMVPRYHSNIATIDLMRYRKNAPSNTMDYLFLEIMESLKEEGIVNFSLGLVPLAGVGENGGGTEERLLGYLYRRGDRLFSFAGLRQFKNKFEPSWHEKHLVYSGGPQNLAQIAVAISQVLKITK